MQRREQVDDREENEYRNTPLYDTGVNKLECALPSRSVVMVVWHICVKRHHPEKYDQHTKRECEEFSFSEYVLHVCIIHPLTQEQSTFISSSQLNWEIFFPFAEHKHCHHAREWHCEYQPYAPDENAYYFCRKDFPVDSKEKCPLS